MISYVQSGDYEEIEKKKSERVDRVREGSYDYNRIDR